MSTLWEYTDHNSLASLNVTSKGKVEEYVINLILSDLSSFRNPRQGEERHPIDGMYMKTSQLFMSHSFPMPPWNPGEGPAYLLSDALIANISY